MGRHVELLGGGEGPVAIVGSGSIGSATAAAFAAKGHTVRIYNRWIEDHERAIIESGLTSTGVVEGNFPIELVSDDMGSVLDGASLIAVCVPAFARPYVAEQMAPHLTPEMKVLFHPGYIGDSLELAAASDTPVETAELNASIYGAAVKPEGSVSVFVRKAAVEVASVPASGGGAWADFVSAIFELPVSVGENVLTVGFNNPNPVYHVPVCLTGMPIIELQLDVGYNDLITPSVLRLFEKVDDERVEIGRKFSESGVIDFWTFLVGAYPVTATDHKEMLHEAYGPYEHLPESLLSRYITEDVPFGLVPWEAIGVALGCDTTAMTSLIDLASSALGRDFRAEGRTLEALKLEPGLTPDDLVKAFGG